MEVKEGDQAKFTCRTSGNPQPEVEWYKDDQLLEESPEVKFENQDGCHSLIIKDVVLDDEAEYKTLARNPWGTASCTAELLVEESANKPELLEPMTDVEVNIYGTFTVFVTQSVTLNSALNMRKKV